MIDINEHRPWFSQSVYTVNVSESVAVYTELTRLNATDIDQDNKVVYSLHCAQNPASINIFKVDYQTGAVILTQPLDRYVVDYSCLIKVHLINCLLQLVCPNLHDFEK